MIWTRKLTGASVLYILNRYLCAVNQVISILPSFVDISSDCMNNYIINQLSNGLSVLQYLVLAGFSGLRVHGVSGRRWKALPVVVVILGTVPLITNTIYSADYRIVPHSRSCDTFEDMGIHTYIQMLFVTQISQCASEMLTLGTTWLYTFQLREVHRYRGGKPSVSLLLLRDGTLYFSISVILSILHIVFWFTRVTAEFGYIAQPMTSTCMSYFFLNLRQIYYSTDDTSEFYQSQPTRLSPDRLVGNMGAPLRRRGSLSIPLSLATSHDDPAIAGPEELPCGSSDDAPVEEMIIIREPFSFGINSAEEIEMLSMNRV